jgi:regulation of enolase protein 1 (concanavalin A-like superfamily)
MTSQPDSTPVQTPPNYRALELLKTLIKQAGLTRKEFLDRLAELEIICDENSLKNWGRKDKGRSFPREVLRPMIQVLVEARTPTDSKRCTALQALEFLGLAGLPGSEFPSLANLFPPDEFNIALKAYFQIDLPLSTNGLALDGATNNQKEYLVNSSETDIANKTISLKITSAQELPIGLSDLNQSDDINEIFSINIPKPLRIPMFVIRKKANLIIVIILIIIAVSIALIERLYFVAMISYPRGTIPLASSGDIHILNPVLTWVQGGANNSSYTLHENTGSVTLTAGGHTNLSKELGNNEPAPMMLLPIQGDFIAQVKISFLPGPVCCKHAGMGVRSIDDINSWIRISRDHANTIQLDGLFRGRTTNSSDENYILDHVWFKIERQRDLFTLSYSADRVDWTSLCNDCKFSLSEDAQIFLFVYSAHQQDMVSAEFSDLSVK